MFSMLAKDKQFKIKLKKCKSLQDYRDLAEEYKIKDDSFTTKYSLSRMIEIMRKHNKIN